MKQGFNVVFLSILAGTCFSGCSGYNNPDIKTLLKDYQAGRDIKNQKYEEALAKYYFLLEDAGGRASVHSNIGVILNSVQRPEDALKSLQYALKLAENNNDQEMIFKIRYNLGVYFGALKKIPEALENYQFALGLGPDSTEIKTNIELLMQQQNQKQQNGKGEQNKENKSQSGEEENKEKKQGDDPKDQKDENKDPQDGKDKKDDKKRESSPKYQPRPFKGEQLSEGDVKKILGELKNQEQKIRANFDKKEKGKSKNNEKDW